MILRPEITIRVCGTTDSIPSRALVDTGADNSIFPASIAKRLGITLVAGNGPPMTAFGGQQLNVWFGDVALELGEEASAVRWNARIQFFEFGAPEEEALVLGHSGFLDYFTATFDGEEASLTLLPNSQLPAVASSSS